MLHRKDNQSSYHQIQHKNPTPLLDVISIDGEIRTVESIIPKGAICEILTSLANAEGADPRCETPANSPSCKRSTLDNAAAREDPTQRLQSKSNNQRNSAEPDAATSQIGIGRFSSNN